MCVGQIAQKDRNVSMCAGGCEFRSLLESFETSHDIKLMVKKVFCVALIAQRICRDHCEFQIHLRLFLDVDHPEAGGQSFDTYN